MTFSQRAFSNLVKFKESYNNVLFEENNCSLDFDLALSHVTGAFETEKSATLVDSKVSTGSAEAGNLHQKFFLPR